MLFSSISFLYYFLPLFLLCYFLSPKSWRNAVVLVFSLAFYAWGEPKYVFLMSGSIVLGYVGGLLLEACHGGHRKWLLVLTVLPHLVALGLFKYYDFFAVNVNAATGLSLPLLRIALPIGISFYTFQLLSYLIDVYRGERAQHSLVRLSAYIAMFPQLIAGPIVRYTDISAQLNSRTSSITDAGLGARRFILGLSKKILLANLLGELCTTFRDSNDKSVLFYWLYAVAFLLHIYFDFSGYSDMAIGLGRICGFSFPENFNYPYISGSITEFWRRWHMTLGSWFRDYVYIPLGGNRVGRWKQLRNIITVWLLTGLWHGAAWTFIAWGALFAVLLMLEKLWLLPYLKKARVWNHVYVLLAVIVSFVIFNADSMGQAFADIGGMFGAGGIALTSVQAMYELRSNIVILLIAAVGTLPLPKYALELAARSAAMQRVLSMAEPVLLAALLVVCTVYLVDGSYNPFLYFRF